MLSGALISLQGTAHALLNTSSEELPAYGFYVLLYDVKTDHIAITLEEGKKTYTTGFIPNLFDFSRDQTTNLKHKLQVLEFLNDKGVAVENILEQINILVADRASDNNIVLDNSGVNEERILKSGKNRT